MVLNYILVGLAVIGIALQFVLQKVYQLRFGKTFAAIVVFSVVSGIVTCLFFLCLNAFKVQFSQFSLWMALALAFCMTFNTVTGIVIVSMGKLSVFTLFMMFGGMLIPYLYGCIFLDEALTAGSIVGMVLLAGALVMPVLQKNGKEEAGGQAAGAKRRLFYPLCCLVFISNGCVSTISKVHQISAAAVPTKDFMIYLNSWVVVIGALILAAVCAANALRRRAHGTAAEEMPAVLPQQDAAAVPRRSAKTVWLAPAVIAASALISGTSQMLQLMGAQDIPATVLYPYITGGTILLTSLAGYVFFKEKITWQIGVSLALAVVGTVLFLF